MTIKMQSHTARRYWIETYGCQMNKYDSEIVAGILESSGFRAAEGADNADIILINTCSVRDHAEKRALGRAASLRSWKNKDDSRRLGIIGCMAQRLGQQLFLRIPHLDLIVGPDNYHRLASFLRDDNKEPRIETRFLSRQLYDSVQPNREKSISGWVAITRGCENFCTYCIVPLTRGKVRSRSHRLILEEIEQMVDQGFREVTLLGQNVNAYHDGKVDFADLLGCCARIPGLLRVRFLTSHPKDLTVKTLEVMAASDSVCSHLHLPLQSGSNCILKRMNRRYTRENYLDLVAKARSLMPRLGFTTDIIVGFPGETESDFQDTLNLVKTVEFDDAFTYYYSPRPGTRAAGMKETLTHDEKLRRLNHLIQLQRRITLEKKQQMIGRVVSVLPERISKLNDEEWMGKTENDHVVVFPGEDCRWGELTSLRIESCHGATLRGRAISTVPASRISKTGRTLCGS
jgi:tRNA-2-methylthio-N6-dimethylallyladenosine synthase